ncbi:MAG: polymer-forming cytoskeletal protein [Firmicutes bacterium]|nr:polymer-forming cytoskeletal protein [Bacillota bacterium]
MSFDSENITPEFSAANISAQMAVIGPNTKIIGTIKTKDSLSVYGKFEGNIESTGFLSLQKDSFVKGTINCHDVLIAGKVLGDINSTGKVGFTSTAVMKGKIRAAFMCSEFGAKLECPVSLNNNGE